MQEKQKDSLHVNLLHFNDLKPLEELSKFIDFEKWVLAHSRRYLSLVLFTPCILKVDFYWYFFA